MERIEAAGERDWRADHARLQLIAPERFGRDRGDGATANNTQLVIADGQLARMVGMLAGMVARRSLPPAAVPAVDCPPAIGLGDIPAKLPEAD